MSIDVCGWSGYNDFMADKQEHCHDLILSREQVRACDQVAIDRFGITGLVLMENAGGAAGRLIISLLEKVDKSRVVIIAGIGNNAGDGFVVARHLFNAGVKVDVVICGLRERFKGDALSNLRIIEHMNLPVSFIDKESTESIARTICSLVQGCDVIVDALLGTGAVGPPRAPIRSVIESLNNCKQTVVALDIPSGLDCDTGEPMELTVKADHTITFAAQKKGFQNPASGYYTGSVTVASIGIAAALLL